MSDGELAARVLMLQNMVGKLFRLIYAEAGYSTETIQKIHDAMIAAAQLDVVAKTSDPAISDASSAEVEQETRAFVAGIEKLLGMADRRLL